MKSNTALHGGPRLFSEEKSPSNGRGSDTKLTQPLVSSSFREKLGCAIMVLFFLLLYLGTLIPARAVTPIQITNQSTVDIGIEFRSYDPDRLVSISALAGTTVQAVLPDINDTFSVYWGSPDGSTTYGGPAYAPPAPFLVNVKTGSIQFTQVDWPVGSPGGTSTDVPPVTMDHVILPFAAGAGFIVLPLLVWALINALRKGMSIGNLT